MHGRAGDSTLVISLSALDRRSLETASGASPSSGVTLAGLKAAGARGLWRLLRTGGHAHVVVAGANDELAVYGPLLSLVALSAAARRREIVNLSTRERRDIGVVSTLVASVRIGWTSLLARRALGAKARELRVLRRRRSSMPAWHGGVARVLYLKSGPFGNVAAGGSVGHVAGVANAWHRRGAEVRLLGAGPQAGIDPAIEQIDVPASRTWAIPLELNVVRYSLAFRRASRAMARRWRPTLVYQRYSPHDLTGADLRALGAPWVLEYNGSEVWTQRNWGKPMRYESLAREVEIAALRTADLVVTVSEPLRREVIADGVPDARVLCYPNCIDPALFDPARFSAADRKVVRSRFDLAPDDFVLTFLGTFGQWHGTDVLADAIRGLVVDECDWMRAKRVRFLLAGNGMLFGETSRRLEGMEEFVRFPGLRPQHEAPEVLAASDVLLSPHKPNADGSEFFGSPTKLIEYMAMARPIVASDLDQIGDIARGWRPLGPRPDPGRPSDLLLLARPGDANDLRRAIRAAVAMSGPERDAMGARARDAVLRGFTWDANVAAIVTRLTELAGTRPARTDARFAEPTLIGRE